MKKLKLCPNCSSDRLADRTLEKARAVAEHVFTVKLPAQACAACGEVFIAGADVVSFDNAVALALLGAGVAHPEALKFLRKATGLPAKEFAALLDVRPETVSRWELGKRPIDRGSYLVLRQLLLEHIHGRSETADYARLLAKPKRLPKVVKLDRKAA